MPPQPTHHPKCHNLSLAQFARHGLPFFGMTEGKKRLPDFHPQGWNGQAFRLANAVTGVCRFDATGSGTATAKIPTPNRYG